MFLELVRLLEGEGEEPSNGGNGFGNRGTVSTSALFAIWIAIVLVLLICPFIGNRNRRRLWLRRCIQCDWSSDETESSFQSLFPAIQVTPRYPIGDPRRKVTKEEADRMTKQFIVDSLFHFTKVLDKNDFKDHDNLYDTEKGINGPTEKKQSSDSLNTSPSTEHTFSEYETIEVSTDSPDNMHEAKPQLKTSSVPSQLLLPAPSVSLSSIQVNSSHLNCKDTKVKRQDLVTRCVNIECSICLNPYMAGDKVSWSGLDCSHAFHQSCIVEWLMTLGKKANDENAGVNGTVVSQFHLCKFKMICPICRQDFIRGKELEKSAVTH